MKQKVLVTGAAGFIFSNFIRWALRYHKDEYEFVSIDKIARSDGMYNVYANKGHKLHIGDICDRHFIDIIFKLEMPDIVIHGAAESHVDDSISGADKFILSNVLGTQIIIDKCLEYNVKKLIYISTDEVYGQLLDEQSSWDESCALNPRNPYSASKAAGELLVKAAGETHGLKYNITRCCNNFGPRQSTKNFIPKIIKNILEEKPIPIYGQGAQIREWIHVADNCSAIMAILNNAPTNEIYNISSNNEISNIELVNMICNIMESGFSLIIFVEDRLGHDFRYSVNNTKIKSLGWEPQFKFKDGLVLCTKWYINNKWFLK